MGRTPLRRGSDAATGLLAARASATRLADDLAQAAADIHRHLQNHDTAFSGGLAAAVADAFSVVDDARNRRTEICHALTGIYSQKAIAMTVDSNITWVSRTVRGG